jgi:hypothetical protein
MATDEGTTMSTAIHATLKLDRPWLHRLQALLRGVVLPDRRREPRSTAEVIGEMRRDFYGMGRRHDD